MESRLGELCSPAPSGNPCGCRALEGDPCGHSPSCIGLARLPLDAVCGGTPLSPVACDPCGRTTQPSDGEGDACRHSPPDKPPVTLRHGCKGTEANILHVGCGGTPPDQMTCDPCGRTASAGDSCSHSPLTTGASDHAYSEGKLLNSTPQRRPVELV